MHGIKEYREYNIQRVPSDTVLDGFILPKGEFVPKPQRTFGLAEYGIEVFENQPPYEELRTLTHVAIIGPAFNRNWENVIKIYIVKVFNGKSYTPLWIVKTLKDNLFIFEILFDEIWNEPRVSVKEDTTSATIFPDFLHMHGRNYSMVIDKEGDPHIIHYEGSSPGSEIRMHDGTTYRATFYKDITNTTSYTLIRKLTSSGLVTTAIFESKEFDIRDRDGYAVKEKIIEAYNKYV